MSKKKQNKLDKRSGTMNGSPIQSDLNSDNAFSEQGLHNATETQQANKKNNR
ncbi:hypothetical protein [Halalkalibacter urbisdiaboli]|uniref:hypothetical protein n=1 Tax=Halalkalibacter urbisdiaboli TaxID=1960589 RepID=UPI0013FDA7F2|nr:hypothetical protein [Halalkalibacter urbisdiaboli]